MKKRMIILASAIVVGGSVFAAEQLEMVRAENSIVVTQDIDFSTLLFEESSLGNLPESVQSTVRGLEVDSFAIEVVATAKTETGQVIFQAILSDRVESKVVFLDDKGKILKTEVVKVETPEVEEPSEGM